MEQLHELVTLAERFQLVNILQALLILIIGYILAKTVSNSVVKLPLGAMSAHAKTLLRRAIFYILLVIALLSTLRQLGFDLSVFLGAAGILSVAIGFASQTSASNLVSGLFLMIERPFSIGDIIQVDKTTGEVISIDLLSIKIRTFDNLYVRVPNESMIKQQVTTLTRFAIRRADLKIGVAYKEDIQRVRDILINIAQNEPLCLSEPEPLFIVTGFGSSSIDLQFSVWVSKDNFLNARNALYQKIKIAFDAEAIEIPFPHISLYAGSTSEPIKVANTQS